MKSRVIVVSIVAIMVCVSVMATAVPLNESATFRHLWEDCWVFKTQTATIGPGYEFVCDFYINFFFFRIRLYSYAVDVSEDGIYINFYFLNPAYRGWTFGGEFHGLSISGLINQDDAKTFQGIGNVVTTMDFGGRTVNDMFTYDRAANELRFNWTQMTMYNGSWLKADFLYADENNPPAVNAGENIRITSRDQSTTVLCGTVADPDDDELTYRWLEDGLPLSDWAAVGENGLTCLDLRNIPYLSPGEYVLNLEGSDGEASVLDDMVLTVDNSAPNASPTGSGVYEIFTPVTLGGDVSDVDGDMLVYQWLKGDEVIFSGTIAAIEGGEPVALPEQVISDLPPGYHTLILSIDDGINNPVIKDILVQVVDKTVPTLAPVANMTILWPPNHKMVDIVIEANAFDNSGGPVTLTAEVLSNEPIEGLGDGDMSPDWTEPEITPDGLILLQLRVERSGLGEGRVYTVVLYATDESGNTSWTEIEFIVPHNQSGNKNRGQSSIVNTKTFTPPGAAHRTGVHRTPSSRSKGKLFL